DAERSAGREAQVDIVDRAQHPARRRQFDRGALYRQQDIGIHSAPSRGSVMARSVSPMMLNDSTVRYMAPAGMKASHGAISRLSRPSPIMLPQLDCGGGTPSPSRLNAPSTTITTATASRK